MVSSSNVNDKSVSQQNLSLWAGPTKNNRMVKKRSSYYKMLQFLNTRIRCRTVPIWWFLHLREVQQRATSLRINQNSNLIRLEKRRFTLPINTRIMNSTIFIFICKYQQEGRQKFITTKRFITATTVSGRQLGRQSSLISSDLSSSKHFCHAAICAQVHSVLDEKHHLVEQVVGITLPASLKGWQAISVFSV